MESNVIDVLSELGYQLQDCGNYYKCAAAWRHGNDVNSVTIYKDTGLVIDHVSGTKFPINVLIAKSLGIESIEKVEEWLQYKGVTISSKPIYPKIKMSKIYPPEILNELMPIHDYFVNRRINEETLREFKGGVALKGRLNNRYVLSIFNSKKEIIGFIGRDVTGKSPMKYKIIGEKSTWVWPAYLNSKILQKEKRVILVESPACVLWMWQNNIKNTLCLFGTECSLAILNFLLRIDAKEIIISTNNEESQIGNEAAKKIESKLLKYFDPNQVKIRLPIKKDFGDMSEIELKEWYKNL